jgi:hypothetical protein
MHAAGSRGTPPARRDETTRRPAPTCLRHADEVMRDTSPTLPHYFSFNPPISEEPTHAVPDRHRSKARAKPARRARGLISVRLPRPACALLARCVKLEQHRRPARSRARMHATSRRGRVGPPHPAIRTSHLSGRRRPRHDARCPQRLCGAVCEHARDHGTGDADAPADQWCRQSGSASRPGGPKRRSTPQRSAGDTEDGWRTRNASHRFTTPLLPLHTAEPPVRPLPKEEQASGHTEHRQIRGAAAAAIPAARGMLAQCAPLEHPRTPPGLDRRLRITRPSRLTRTYLV